MMQRMTGRVALLAGVAALLGQAVPAAAGTLDWDFSYTGAGITASGVFTTSDTPVGGAYEVTGITGTRNGSAITALVALGNFLGNDNLLRPAAPYVDFNGISYVAGGASYNILTTVGACPGIQVEATTTFSCATLNAISLVVTPRGELPEPVSLALLATGLLGLGAARRAQRATA